MKDAARQLELARAAQEVTEVAATSARTTGQYAFGTQFDKLEIANSRTNGSLQAGMAELADALDLGSSAVKGVQVQVLFPAPEAHL